MGLFAKLSRILALFFSSWSNSSITSNSSYRLLNMSSDIGFIFRNIFFKPTSDCSMSNLPITQYGIYTFNFFSTLSFIQFLSPYISIGTLLTVILFALKPALKKTKIKKERITQTDVLQKLREVI